MKPLIALALTAVLFSSGSAFANGSSRGGGNGVVCFSDAKYAQQFTRIDPDTGKTIYLPFSSQKNPEAFQNIIDIEMTDAYSMTKETKVFLNNVISSRFPQVSQLNDAYAWMISRMVGIYPAWQELNGAAATLALGQAVPFGNGLLPVLDTPLVGNIPNNCILSTLFVQVSSGISMLWYYNPELFYHPKHSRVSQAVTLLHERVYSLARSKQDPATSSDLTMIFVHRLLDPRSSWVFLADAFNKVKVTYGNPVLDRDYDGNDLPGAKTFMDIYNQLEAILGKSLLNYRVHNECLTQDPAALKKAQELYLHKLQKPLLNDQRISLTLRHEFDDDVKIYLGLSDYRIVYEGTLSEYNASRGNCYISLIHWMQELSARYVVPFEGLTPEIRLTNDDLNRLTQSQ